MEIIGAMIQDRLDGPLLVWLILQSPLDRAELVYSTLHVMLCNRMRTLPRVLPLLRPPLGPDFCFPPLPSINFVTSPLLP